MAPETEAHVIGCSRRAVFERKILEGKVPQYPDFLKKGGPV